MDPRFDQPDDVPPASLVCLQRFFDAPTAHIARSVLDSEGIFACLETEETNTMLQYVGTALGGVKLLVQADQLEKAKSILAAHSENDFLDDDADNKLPAEADDDEIEDSPEQRERDGHIRRAWTAAILGIMLCPPAMTCYSFYLLIRHGLLSDDQRFPKDWRVNAALAVNLLVFAVSAYGWMVILGPRSDPTWP